MSRHLRPLLGRYNTLLQSRPLLTKSCTGLVLAGAGDLFAQRLDPGTGRVSPARRFLVFASFGALWTGPFNHYWLRFLARTFQGSGWTPVLKKLAVHHLLWNSFVYLPVLFGYVGVMQGFTRKELEDWVRRDYFRMLVLCWVVWIPITGAMFKWVPEHFQSVTMSGISLVWNSGLSWMCHRKAVLENERPVGREKSDE